MSQAPRITNSANGRRSFGCSRSRKASLKFAGSPGRPSAITQSMRTELGTARLAVKAARSKPPIACATKPCACAWSAKLIHAAPASKALPGSGLAGYSGVATDSNKLQATTKAPAC